MRLLTTVGNLNFLAGNYWTQLLVAATVFLVLQWLIKLVQGTPTVKRPPCMPCIPIVGTLPFLRDVRYRLHHFLHQQAAKYGDVFGLYLASRYVVVLKGRDLVAEALVKNAAAFADRPRFFLAFNYVNPRDKGLFMARYDAAFRRKHQTCLSILKEFGFGQHAMEARINAEVAEFIDQIRQKEGRPFDPSSMITHYVTNVIIGMLFGRRYEFGDPAIERMIDHHTALLKDVVPEVGLWPALRFLPTISRRIRSTMQAMTTLLKDMDEEVNAVLSGNDDERDDSFIKRFVELTSAGGSTTSPNKNGFDREELLFTLKDLFSGGRETLSHTIEWALMELANYPDVLIRMRKEVDDVIGTDRLPSLDDKSRMPYTQAVILETLRRHPVAPLALFHSTICDSYVGDYFIPKDTMVIINIFGTHMDAATWTDPIAFRPERFLDERGDVTGQHRIIPFSLGKRSCLGEMLARQELFLFLAAIVQSFEILPPEGQDKILVDEDETFIAAPTPYQLRLKARYQKSC